MRFALSGGDRTSGGYFLFGEGSTCYGTSHGGVSARHPGDALHDAFDDVVIRNGTAYLTFDPDEVIENLRRETYAAELVNGASTLVTRLYYFLRPALSVGVRRHLQRFHLRAWDQLSFPRWPVDCSADNLMEKMMLLALRSSGAHSIPFIWFWPEGKPGCAIMTHDVETEEGRDFCARLMDVDDSRGIKSSFQVIPEERYAVSGEFLQSIRQRDFEIVVHDLNHDGHLYRDRAQFLERAARINRYVQQYGATGFRAAVLYRRQVWYDALKCSYDMSVPNVAHLDPQRGGCCTVTPYFVGDVLEIPVTTVQDYTLFYILNDYSIALWKRQTEQVMEKHGIMSFIVHPDYVMEPKELAIYQQLLDYLAELRQEKDIWITTPGEVNRWWRQRAEMRLVETAAGWRIEGEGRERARIAYASEEDGRVVFTMDRPTASMPSLVSHGLAAPYSLGGRHAGEEALWY